MKKQKDPKYTVRCMWDRLMMRGVDVMRVNARMTFIRDHTGQIFHDRMRGDADIRERWMFTPAERAAWCKLTGTDPVEFRRELRAHWKREDAAEREEQIDRVRRDAKELGFELTATKKARS